MLGLSLLCSPTYKSKNIHPINETQAIQTAIQGNYDYVVVHSAGDKDEDHARQDLALYLYRVNSISTTKAKPIFFLDGYECMNTDRTIKSLDEVFKTDYRIHGRRNIFPEDSLIEIAYARNTPENTEQLRKRKHPERKKILIVTSDYHAPRVSQVTSKYFDKMDEQIDVLGVETAQGSSLKKILFEFFSRWQTNAIYKDFLCTDAENLTQHYNKEVYNNVNGSLVKKPAYIQAYNLIKRLIGKN